MAPSPSPSPSPSPPVVLFGYDSSPFTQKVRLALRLKQIPYTFVIVPSMMPRPIVKDNFNITYRKIPILAIGREIYIDTSLILEVLEHRFPASEGFGTLYPGPTTTPTPSSSSASAPSSSSASASSSSSQRPLIRGFASYWTDRPLFRVTTGLIPSSVWRTRFGADRANLIGHSLDAEKLERKVPENLGGLDLQLSLLEPLFRGSNDNTKSVGAGVSAGAVAGPGPGTGSVAISNRHWVFDGPTPSAADIALYYQLDWGDKISRGQGISDLSGGGVRDGDGEGISSVFNADRYPGLAAWFDRVKTFFDSLPSTETRVERTDETGIQRVLDRIKALPGLGGATASVSSAEEEVVVPSSASSSSAEVVPGQVSVSVEVPIPLLPTPAAPHATLDKRNGLVVGAHVTVAPEDTGRDSPTHGTLLAITPEEVVVAPDKIGGGPAVGAVKVHFPRLGFVVRPVPGTGTSEPRL